MSHLILLYFGALTGRFIRLLCLFIVLNSAIFLFQSKTFAFETSSADVLLQNGLRLIVKPRSSFALVAVDLWLRAGAREERKGDFGSAHFLEHAIFKGTSKRAPGESDVAVENLGATLNAATGPDYAHYYTTVSSSRLSEVLAELSDIVQNATLTDAEVERERRVILSELSQRDADPNNVIIGKLYQSTFGTHSYSRQPGGTSDEIRLRYRDTLARFYALHYNPENATLVITGNCKPEVAKLIVQSTFGNWKSSSSATPGGRDILPPPSYTPATLIERSGTGAGVVGIAYPAPAAKDSIAACTGQVLAALFGDSEYGGRLSTPLLRGYSVRTNYTPRIDISLMSFAASYAFQSSSGIVETADSRNLRLSQLRSSLNAVIQAMRSHPPRRAEIESAKQRVLGNIIFSQETDSGFAAALGYAAIVGGDSPEAFRKRLQQVNEQGLEQYIQTYLKESLQSTIILN